MTQVISEHRHVQALPLLPIEAVPHGAINLEPVQYSDCQPMLDQQNWVSLEAEAELPELCDSEDVAIAVLEGQGSLTLNEEVVTLVPGMLVFIPAYMPHVLRTPAHLVFLLLRCEPDPATIESVWLFNL